MIPSRMTIVPFSIVPFVTVSMRALVSAHGPADAGAWAWASPAARSAAPRTRPLTSGRARRMQALLMIAESPILSRLIGHGKRPKTDHGGQNNCSDPRDRCQLFDATWRERNACRAAISDRKSVV